MLALKCPTRGKVQFSDIDSSWIYQQTKLFKFNPKIFVSGKHWGSLWLSPRDDVSGFMANHSRHGGGCMVTIHFIILHL